MGAGHGVTVPNASEVSVFVSDAGYEGAAARGRGHALRDRAPA